jgi:hypothetical protein
MKTPASHRRPHAKHRDDVDRRQQRRRVEAHGGRLRSGRGTPRSKDLEGLIAPSMLVAYVGHLHAAEDPPRTLKQHFPVAGEVGEPRAQVRQLSGERSPAGLRARMVPEAETPQPHPDVPQLPRRARPPPGRRVGRAPRPGGDGQAAGAAADGAGDEPGAGAVV